MRYARDRNPLKKVMKYGLCVRAGLWRNENVFRFGSKYKHASWASLEAGVEFFVETVVRQDRYVPAV